MKLGLPHRGVVCRRHVVRPSQQIWEQGEILAGIRMHVNADPQAHLARIKMFSQELVSQLTCSHAWE